MDNTTANTFKSPGSAYRGKPFWAWNGPLDPEELRRQIRVMNAMGLGGFFMHSRVGLDTPYLSDEWMDCIGACIDEARKLGMEAWLYDEDRWPSGAAGGLVTCEERFRQRKLMCLKRAKGARKPADTIATFAVTKRGDAMTAYRRLRKSDRAKDGEAVYDFYVEINPESSWYNGQTYLDTMNHDAVKRFIEVTHEAYRKNFADEFGKTVPGIFTDEPEYGHTFLTHPTLPQIPWTAALPKVFKERYGYDLRNKLPEVYFDIKGQPVSQARYHYHDCITHLLVDAFSRQIGEWCGENDLLFTGHVLAEGTPSSQTSVVGAAMRFYEYMQAPGIDILTEKRPEFDTAKQCSSVLHQMGRTWALSETYGCTGWDFSFEGHKAIGDWQAAMGINLRCQHLFWYTMLGEAKRDYPASIGYQSPWWPIYDAVESYFARLNLMLTQGDPVRDLLVVHPIESTWARIAGGKTATAASEELNGRLASLRDTLLQAHVDYDYGDEEMLSRLARVSRTKEGPRFIVGKASYKAVLLPRVLTVRQTTLDLLADFARAGGTVVVVGEAPEYVDAAPSKAGKAIAAGDGVTLCADSPAGIRRAVEPARTVSITDKRGHEAQSVLYHLRETKDGRVLFACNIDRKKDVGPVRILCAGRAAEEWDLTTGERCKAVTSRDGDNLVIHTDLPTSGSRLFVVRDAAVKGLPSARTAKTLRARTLAQKAWDIQRSEPNVLVLDRATWRLGDGPEQPALDILKIDHAVCAELGLPRRGGKMVQPWLRDKNVSGPSGPLELRYTIQVDDLPEGPLALAIEKPEQFEVELNGRPAHPDAESGWWVDRSLRIVPLCPNMLHEGENALVLRTTYSADSGLESMYLLGEFGVKVSGDQAALVARPDTLRVGDWTKQGLPFYAGAVTYTCRVKNPAKARERLVLELPKWRGACVGVTIDAQPTGVIAWPPHELDLTDVAPRGDFTLGIVVVGHRRNSHGPLHMANNPKPGWIGPAQFVTEGDDWTDDYLLVPAGLLAEPVLSVRKSEVAQAED